MTTPTNDDVLALLAAKRAQLVALIAALDKAIEALTPGVVMKGT